MLQPRMLGAVALLGLLAGAAASAGDRHQSSGAYYSSAPQVRLGLDVIWGGYGYAPPPPPVAWYPTYYPVYYPAYYPVDRHYDQGNGRGYGRGHYKHRHGPHRGDD